MNGPGALIGLLVATALAGPAFAQELVVIVHADRTVALTRAEVAQIFLKQRRYWDDGDVILPINRNSGSDVRESFVRAIFGEAARRLEGYWNRQYFRGVLPPATLASDEAVKRFVAGERRAIGYVAPALLDGSVGVALRIDAPDSADR